MWGSITNPYFSDHEEHKTRIHTTKGKFSLIDPIENGFVIEHGAQIIVDDGDIIVGDVFGKKETLPDPSGKVGILKKKLFQTHQAKLEFSLQKNILLN